MNRFIFFCGLIVVAMFSSCGNDPRLEIVPSVSSQAHAAPIKGVDIYVDCSGSMKGYVQFDPKDAATAKQSFKDIVPTFANNVRPIFGNEPDIYKIRDLSETKVPLTSFIRDLNSGDIFGGAATELDKIITKMIAKQQTDSINKVYVLITDGVLSYGRTLVNANNRMYNISNQHTLQELLHKALNTDTTLSLTIIKYLSDFNGKNYYTCQELVGYENQLLANRPFYFLILGKKDLISTFLSKPNLLPQSEGVFSITNPIDLKIGIFKKKTENEKGINTSLQVKDEEDFVIASTNWDKGKDKVFIVGINKNNIPSNFYSDISFFNTLKCDEKNVKIEKLANAGVADGVDDNSKIENPYKAQNFDFFYKITLKKTMFDNALIDKQLTFYFEPSLDIAKSHIDIDYNLANIKELENKTWGFNLITGAIQKANAGKIPQGAKFVLTLNKTNK